MTELLIVVWVIWAVLLTWRQVRHDRRLRDVEYKMEARR